MLSIVYKTVIVSAMGAAVRVQPVAGSTSARPTLSVDVRSYWTATTQPGGKVHFLFSFIMERKSQ